MRKPGDILSLSPDGKTTTLQNNGCIRLMPVIETASEEPPEIRKIAIKPRGRKRKRA